MLPYGVTMHAALLMLEQCGNEWLWTVHPFLVQKKRNLTKQRCCLGWEKNIRPPPWLANWNTANRDTANSVFPYVCSVKFVILCLCFSSRVRKDQAVVALYSVKYPFSVAQPSPYHCIKLTSKARFINKNKIRNYSLGPLHAVTCLVLSKKDDKQNSQIKWIFGKEIKRDKETVSTVYQSLIHCVKG